MVACFRPVDPGSGLRQLLPRRRGFSTGVVEYRACLRSVCRRFCRIDARYAGHPETLVITVVSSATSTLDDVRGGAALRYFIVGISDSQGSRWNTSISINIAHGQAEDGMWTHMKLGMEPGECDPNRGAVLHQYIGGHGRSREARSWHRTLGLNPSFT